MSSSYFHVLPSDLNFVIIRTRSLLLCRQDEFTKLDEIKKKNATKLLR